MDVSEKKEIDVVVRPRSGSDDSSTPSSKSSRVPRFAEATSVNSPIDPAPLNKLPFARPQTLSYHPQQQPGDVGFGYLGDVRRSNYLGPAIEMPATPFTPRTPLKSAMRTPGAPPRHLENPFSPTFQGNPLSPTSKEEEALEKQEGETDLEQAKDLKVKVRVRLAKIVLRGTNFACSLIILSMLSSTFTIFNATKALPPRNNLPPWAVGTQIWPQVTLLCIAGVSLVMSIYVMWTFWRKGQRKGRKIAAYYTAFSVAFYTFSIIMWGIGAGILHMSKANGKGQDIWGWSCKNNVRSQLFQSDVSYSLICRMQNWSLLCALIEVTIEVITISIYSIVFYRFWSKRRLRKSMAKRDEARESLYLAQLRLQSAPNTAGLPPPSARDGGYNPLFSPRYTAQDKGAHADEYGVAEEGLANSIQYVQAPPTNTVVQKPFHLQPPPLKNTPRIHQSKTFEPPRIEIHSPVTTPSQEMPSQFPPFHQPLEEISHHPAAPGEQCYDAVPIPGAYAPLANPAS